MFQHLLKWHPREHAIVKPSLTTISKKPATQLTLIQSIHKKTKYTTSSQQHKTITDAMTRCIAESMLPVRLVDSVSFRDMVTALNPQYALPSRTHFRYVAIPALYNKVKLTVEEEMRNVTSYSLTMDAWSSVTTDPFLCVTAHYVDSDFFLKAKCLACVYVPEDHTGVNISKRVQEVLDEYKLTKEKLMAVTTDAGTNMVVALRELSVRRLTCFGHVLHNAITRALNKDNRISRTLGLCRKIVSAFSFSFKKRREFRIIQESLEVDQKTLKSDVSTRWGSMYKMLKSIKANHQAIQQLFSKGIL